MCSLPGAIEYGDSLIEQTWEVYDTSRDTKKPGKGDYKTYPLVCIPPFGMSSDVFFLVSYLD